MIDPIGHLKPKDIIENAKKQMILASIPIKGLYVGSDLRNIGDANLVILDAKGNEIEHISSNRIMLTKVSGISAKVCSFSNQGSGRDLRRMQDLLKGLGFVQRWASINMQGNGDAFFCNPSHSISGMMCLEID